MKKKVSVSWSGGKDSAMALLRTIESDQFEVAELHTFYHPEKKKVNIHELPIDLIRTQADHLGLPIHLIPVSDEQGDYVKKAQAYYRSREKEMDGVVFGDIYLEELRTFKINLLQGYDLDSFFPLWGMDTGHLLREFSSCFRAIICALTSPPLDPGLLGKDLTPDILPGNIDPCGENGEYHTFVYDGKLFRRPVSFKPGRVRTEQYSLKRSDGHIGTYEQYVIEVASTI